MAETRLALYRKWRPLTFDDVVGQDHITQALRNQVESKRLSHAYLFTGTRGTGKTSCAKILARAACCENTFRGNPCNKCPSCLSSLSDSALDITEIDAASNNGVDNIRELREEAVFTPASLKYRIYIIDEMHMLSPGAFNALLKILEEPPSHVLFILATTELHKLPATILSRCQRFDFRRIPMETIAASLLGIAENEHFSLEEDAAMLLARRGAGSMRDAISLLDRCAGEGDSINRESVTRALGIASGQTVMSIASAVMEGDGAKALTAFTSAYIDGRDLLSIFDELLSFLRDVYVVQSVGVQSILVSAMSDDTGMLQEYAAKCSVQRLEYYIDTVSDLLRKVTRTAIRRTDCEMCILKMCGYERQNVRYSHVMEKPAVQLQNPVASAAAVNAAPAEKEESLPWDAGDSDANEADSGSNAASVAAAEELPAAAETSAAKEPLESAPPIAPADGRDYKSELLSVVSGKINSAVRTYLNLAHFENIDNTLVIYVLEESMIFMQKPAIKQVLDEGAKSLSLSGANIKTMQDKDEAPAPASKADSILARARNLGIKVE